MKKTLALLLAAVLTLGALAGCGAEPAPSGTDSPGDGELGLVGFCSLSMSESIYVLTQQALEEIFEGRAEVQTVSCDNDSATQISQINTFALMGADLIVINPTDIDALADAIIAAKEAGCKIYINGATSDSLGEEHYDCCTVSDEYLCGAYVAMIAKNWIETHAETLDASGDWEIAFLESSLSEETVKRSIGEKSILEPYLKDWEGNYVDASGNVVDEAARVENPAYCELAAAHYKGVTVEQDQQNGGLNVASILTTNPNTRVFIAYNSLASTQGGQYIVDNYAGRLDEFAFFSAGVMGNEADYIVGSVSGTDGVLSVFRGACQFGVSAAGGEVADSVAHTAYAIMYGEEGVDYFKRNPDGIAAWWAVDEAQGDGLASVAHFNILSGATVQAFDPIGALTDENTVFYWNSRDGFVEEKEAGGDEPTQPGERPGLTGVTIPAGVYDFDEYIAAMDVSYTWHVTLNEDGSFHILQDNEGMGNPAWTGTEWVDNGDGTFTTVAAEGEGPMIAGFWEDGSITWQLLNGGRCTPVKYDDYAKDVEAYGLYTGAAGAPVAAGTYTYAETTPFGEVGWTVTLHEDGSFVVAQPENESMGNPEWTGTAWVDHGDGTFTTVAAQGDGPMIAEFWESDGSITWVDNGDGTVTPAALAG